MRRKNGKSLVCWVAEMWVSTEMFLPQRCLTEGSFPWVKTFISHRKPTIHTINKQTNKTQVNCTKQHLLLSWAEGSGFCSEYLSGALVFCPQSYFQTWTTSTLHKDHTSCLAANAFLPSPASLRSNLQQLSSLERNSQTAQSDFIFLRPVSNNPRFPFPIKRVCLC